ncbi:MAG: 1-deoxy-D-xylulose-5-phosphate reductoisomerase [Candidatus Tyrphobacter sp.]
MSERKRVAILGSTGSIGTQALDVIARFPDRFDVVALAAGRNVDLLREQAQRFECAVTASAQDGQSGLYRVAVESNPDVVLAATDGAVAFDAIFAAVERGIDVAVANKELIVAAGELLMRLAAKCGARILPVDSEHSAIFQCLIGETHESVERIVLTASGGPFLRAPRQEIENATVEAALAHPTWRMGHKNTIDSATLMNKGLEVIEASRLFGMPVQRIGVVVHPQSVVHGFVLFTDGSVKAQLAAPDMRLPIGYALAYPQRLTWSPFEGGSELLAIGGKPGEAAIRYDYELPDLERFPCLGLAYEALARGGAAPAVLSAANEVAVEAFIEGKMRFGEIARLIERVMGEVLRQDDGELTLDGVRLADRRARACAEGIIGKVTT